MRAVGIAIEGVVKSADEDVAADVGDVSSAYKRRPRPRLEDIAEDVAADVGEDVVEDVCGAASVAKVAYGKATAYVPVYMLYTYFPINWGILENNSPFRSNVWGKRFPLLGQEGFAS